MGLQGTDDLSNLGNNIVKWHGAPNAIDGAFSVNHNKSRNDFGNGFYCNSLRSMANDYALRGDVPELYEVKFPYLGSYKVYRFLNLQYWIAFICYNRGYINGNTNLFKEMDKLNSDYDLIIGEIADDNVTEQLPKFVEDKLPFEVLVKQLMVANLGCQWVIKSQKLLHECEIKQLELITRTRFTREGLQQEIREIENSWDGNRTYCSTILRNLEL